MTDIERREIFAHRAWKKLDGEDVMNYSGFKCALADAERRFADSTPTDTARAEDDEHMTGIIECAKCEYIHTRKERVDVPINDTMNESRCPMCQSAQFYNEPKSDNELFAAKRRIKELESEAAPIRAEVERVRWEKELVMRQLSAANQRIAEMEKQIESNKKALASNGTISGTGTARSSARTNSLRSMYSKRLPGIGK